MLSAILFLPVLGWLIQAGGPAYLAYCMILLCVAVLEFHRLGNRALPVFACALGVLAMAAGTLKEREVLALLGDRAPLHFGMVGVLAAALFFMVWIADLVGGRGVDPRRAAWAAAGMLYVGGAGLYLVRLRLVDFSGADRGATGTVAIALAYGLAWAGDTGAYAVGLLLGRTPLGPVSPRKTWEGSAGGLVVVIAVGAALGSSWCPFLGTARGAALGLLAGIAGQLGDLAESMIKRFAGAKDSASFIPGHGGVLDRFDSLLLAAPVVYHFLLWNASRP